MGGHVILGQWHVWVIVIEMVKEVGRHGSWAVGESHLLRHIINKLNPSTWVIVSVSCHSQHSGACVAADNTRARSKVYVLLKNVRHDVG
jgi:hypothetical protein